MKIQFKHFKRILTVTAALLTAAIVINSAGAYNLQYAQLKGGVKNQTYYIGSSNSRYVNASNMAMDDWNYAVQNTNLTKGLGFSFTPSTKITGSTIRFWGEYLGEGSVAATTRYYILNNKMESKKVGNYADRDYADIVYNLSVTETNANTYNQYYLKSTAGHEAGHALGLEHTTDTGTLMYNTHSLRTAHSPTADEVNGIYAIYK